LFVLSHFFGFTVTLEMFLQKQFPLLGSGIPYHTTAYSCTAIYNRLKNHSHQMALQDGRTHCKHKWILRIYRPILFILLTLLVLKLSHLLGNRMESVQEVTNNFYRHMFVLSYMCFTFWNFRHRLVRHYVRNSSLLIKLFVF